jgi:ubiquinone/menaquinone biosynthesis C-methylase UbiE
MHGLRTIETYWSERARKFDEEPDHGLTDPVVRRAWRDRLAGWIPSHADKVVDLGCGTGSLSVLLAESGLDVIGVDLSPAMVAQATAKAQAAGVAVEFIVGDASDPGLVHETVDVVLCRHLLWTLADPVVALSRWARLISPDGRFVLVEGRWFSPASESLGDQGLPWDGGVSAVELKEALTPIFSEIAHHQLCNDPPLWGSPVQDERYAVVAHNLRQQPIT